MSGPGTSERWRLFIALPVPRTVREAIAVALAPYRTRFPQARWLEARTWHITLLFLGDVAVTRIDDLVALIDDDAADVGAMQLSLGAAGGRIGRRDAVAWLAIAPPSAGDVIALADRLLAAFPAVLLASVPPKRTPAAHLTVARKADASLTSALANDEYGVIEASWTSDRIALVRSHLDASGATYETLHQARCRLAPGDAQVSAEGTVGSSAVRR